MRSYRGVTRVCIGLIGVTSLCVGQTMEARGASTLATFMLVRTTSGASSYELSVTATALQDRPALYGLASTRSVGGRIVSTSTGFAESLYATDPEEAGLAGQRTSLCKRSNHQLQLCWSPGPGGAGSAFFVTWYKSDGSSKGADNLVFVVAQGVATGVSFKGQGWKLVRIPLSYRAHDSSSASFAWFSVIHSVGGDVFEETQAPGGRYGSLAVATPPCTNLGVGGIGSVTLRGGTTTPTMTCPTAASSPVLTSFAPRSTSWNFSGIAAGANYYTKNRLFIVDLPRALPHTSG